MTQGFRITRLAALLCVLCAFSLAVVGCGSSSSSSSGTASATATNGSASISHTKAKFVLHAGLAFGAFHRWIYKPLKAGDFRHPFSHKLTIVKAALAAGFVAHELKLALTDAQADATLSKFTAPITAIQNKLSGAGSAIRSGNVDTSQFDSANSLIDSVRSQAAAAGNPITEQTPAAP
ncbi:MAG: hypothetical protein ACXVFQ_22570 [Solirubrobacteraceae bacterium]